MTLRTSSKNILALSALCLPLLIAGCGALPITLVGALPMMVSAGGGGVAYTMTNTAYKTFSYPIGEVEGALHDALGKMEIQEKNTVAVEDGLEITAGTRKLDIYIFLEKVTATTTRVKVNAKRGAILKDKATATEIIVQINNGLEQTMPAKASPRVPPQTRRLGRQITL